jgi:hypothetical protein
VHLIDAEGARQVRSAAMIANSIPFAQIENIGLCFFVLGPADEQWFPFSRVWMEQLKLPSALPIPRHHMDYLFLLAIVIRRN